MLLQQPTTPSAYRQRCYDCFRPLDACFCASIPRIDNQTQVLILQHRRERFHPFNTARIVQKALFNSRLMVDRTANLAERLRLSDGAALLYPGPRSALLSEVTPETRPKQLVILDGTWHQAKTLLRDIPALGQLPRYRLVPQSPSRYRIRREPTATALSTVEAAVAALRILEPQTAGLEKLLAAFDVMVDQQLGYPGSARLPRFRENHERTYRNLPRALLGDLSNIVVAYGESSAAERGRKRTLGPPVVWVAERLGSEETFSCLLRQPHKPAPALLHHWELAETDFTAAVSPEEARNQWERFCRPDDTIAVFNPGTAHLLAQLAGREMPCVVLKAVYLPWEEWPAALEQVMAARKITCGPVKHLGRAGKRLANAAGLVRHLHWLGAAHLRELSAALGRAVS